MKVSNILLLLVVAGFFVLLLSNLSKNVTQYVDLATAAKANEEVHVVGHWVKKELAQYDPERDLFTFYMQDSLQNEALVHYYDPKPANFEQADKLVLIGKHEGAHFRADKILMKCPSKYEENTLQAPDHSGAPTRETSL